MKKDNAFTGLEAAIVLIAFVVVAAVFSYVLLGAGFFATQKAQEVTYSGIQQTTSNMYLVGQVYGNVQPDSDGVNVLSTINLKLGIPEGGQPQDISQIQLLFSNDTALPISLTPMNPINEIIDNANKWNVTAINGASEQDSRLYPGDKADIEISLSPDHKITSQRLDGYSRTFTLEIKPRIGASYLISKTLSTGFSHGPLY